MKVLYLTKYSRMAGSSRMRSYQYFPYLEEAGFEVEAKPFFDDVYLQNLYSGKSNKISILKSYIRRFFVLFSVFRYSILVIEKEIFPYFPAWPERILHAFGVKYIVDYDDAIFHNYDQSSNSLIKSFLGDKIKNVMKNSSLVVAGNQYLAEYAKKAKAKNVIVIPTVIDLNRYFIGTKSANSKFILGWIGTQSTFEKHLLPCKNWIIELVEQNSDMEFHVIGIPENQNWGERIKWIKWTEDSEVSSLQNLDAGIMPLQDSLWEKGKCAYKLIQYGACGLPSVASKIGMNQEVILDKKTGFFAMSDEEWKQKIEELKSDSLLRENLGQNAREKIENEFSIQVTSAKWVDSISKLLS